MSSISRRLLQAAICIGACVPVAGGFFGMNFGTAVFSSNAGPMLQNHLNYLSGILFAIGLAFWSCVPEIETKGAQMRLLTFLVVVGGFMRLGHSAMYGFYPAGTVFALCMELIVTPLLCLWQWKISKVGH